jgi:serine/threonine protein phosphatase PrpC
MPPSWTRRTAGSHVDSGSFSEAGFRPDNQDRCAATSCWAVVSDGLGGHRGGALAAQLTVDAVVGCLSTLRGHDEYVAEQALRSANQAVLAERALDPANAEMCATVTLALVTSCRPQRSRWLVTNIGDSPAWLLTAQGILRLTEDDNLAAELARAGTISNDVALRHPGRHIVTRAIGLPDRMLWPRHRVTLGPGDVLLIGSDGLADLMDTEAGKALIDVLIIDDTVVDGAQAMAERLVAAALDHGAADNVTAAVLRHLE